VNMLALYILIALQVADIVTTLLCLRTGRAKEANPVLARLFAAVGAVPGLLLVKGGFVAFLWWAAPSLPVQVVYLLMALYIWVLINNLRTLRGLYT